MPAGWLLAVYRTPTSPSTARVAAWRGLHALGGLFIAPTVCVLPPAVADTRQLEAIALRVRSAGGSFEVLEVEAFAEATELTLRVEENEADLAKLQRWLRRVRARDVFASSGRAAAVAAVERAAARLEAFVGDAIAREQDQADANADINPRPRRP